jgi:hypothetical protein
MTTLDTTQVFLRMISTELRTSSRRVHEIECGPQGAQASPTRACCPSKLRPNKHLARANDLGAASGNRTPDLRITSREQEVFRAASTPDAVRQVLLSPQMIGP